MADVSKYNESLQRMHSVCDRGMRTVRLALG